MVRASPTVEQKQNYRCSLEKNILKQWGKIIDAHLKKTFSNSGAILQAKGLLVNSCHQYLGKYCWELFTSNLRLKDGKFHFALSNMTVGEVFLGIVSTLSWQPNTKINITKYSANTQTFYKQSSICHKQSSSDIIA